MTTSEDTVAVFTGKSLDSILREGGSQSWKLDAGRARKCHYVVCTQNAHNVEAYADGTEDHGSAFLVGRISRIVPATAGEPSRWKIQFSEYARISIPNVWTGDRNPVRYTTLVDLGIDLRGAKFEKFEDQSTSAQAPTIAVAGLTIRQAKAGLARTYDVDVDAIEIVIRG
ncbi:hypothetical protein [Rhodococcus sp. P1Y]|uniref:hypothetical protein n=1 Tax=Rhodococcus sp. P1Y TaxID=1302308 RepID=UPI000EACDE0B|nr:hypothetical protein [Rhodococcus sp. P1Y]AYJ48573.1 hypothetical protein D8W71_09785 [Rhodococcus sp. P1Y]